MITEIIYNCLYYVKPIFKTLFTIFISVVFHILCSKLYQYHCIGDGLFSIIHTLLYMPNPQCRILLDIMKYTSDIYVLFCTILITEILVNFNFFKGNMYQH